VIPGADGIERRAVDVGQAGDCEEVRPLGERRQVHHLGDRTAADHRYAKRTFHGSLEKVGQTDRLSHSKVNRFQARHRRASPERSGANGAPRATA